MINSSFISSFNQPNQANGQAAISSRPRWNSLPPDDLSHQMQLDEREIIAILQGFIKPPQAITNRNASPTSGTRDIFTHTSVSNLPATLPPLPVLDSTPLEEHVQLDLEGIQELFRSQQVRTLDQPESDPANSFQAFQYQNPAHHPTPALPGNRTGFHSPFSKTGKQFPNNLLAPKAPSHKKSKHVQECEKQIKEALQNPPKDKKSLPPYVKKALVQREYHLQDNNPNALATLSQEYAVNPRQLQRWLNRHEDPIQT